MPFAFYFVNRETAYSVVMSAKLEAKSGGYQIIIH